MRFLKNFAQVKISSTCFIILNMEPLDIHKLQGNSGMKVFEFILALWKSKGRKNLCPDKAEQVFC